MINPYKICIASWGLFCCLFMSAGEVSASGPGASCRYALVIGGRSGTNSLRHDNINFVRNLRTFLSDRKKYCFRPENIRIYINGGAEALPGCADANLPAVKREFVVLEKTLRKNDELWLFLCGYASSSSHGYSLATKKGRLRGPAIADFLKKIKARKFVFCFTPSGGPLIDELKNIKNLSMVSATDSAGQNSMPRLPEFFARNMQRGEITDMTKLIDSSVRDLKAYYKSRSLLMPESAVMLSKGKRYSLPVGDKEKYQTGIFPAMKNISYAETKAKLTATHKAAINLPDAFIIKVADKQSQDKINAAKSVSARYSEYNAFYPVEKITVICNKDKSKRTLVNSQVYMNSDIAAEIYGFHRFPAAARVDLARVIYPDGTYHDATVNNFPGGRIVRFPLLKKGCLLEIKYVLDALPGKQICEIYGSIPVQHHIPVHSSEVKLEVPEKMSMFWKLANGSNAPVINPMSAGRQIVYKFTGVPALEILPFSPPEQEISRRVMFSSISTWTSLAETIERISRPSRKLDGETVEFARKLTSGASSDTEKVRRIYEYLCNLRYMTTRVGVDALKPRNPARVIKECFGDCKDKANALVVLAGALGVKGYVALLNRGKYTDTTFPGWQFNHAAAYFPELSGFPNGLWCDPTDGSTVFASLPPGDIGREALLLDGKKSRFVPMTPGLAGVNLIEQHITLKKNRENYSGIIKLKLTGLPDYELRRQLKRMGPKQKRYLLLAKLSEIMPMGELGSYRIVNPLERIDLPLEIEFEVTMPASAAPRHTGLGCNNIYAAFIAEKRPNGVVVNDAQPLTVIQELKVSGERQKHFCECTSYVGNVFYTSCHTANGSDFWSRKIKLELKGGLIKGDNYEKVRKIIRLFCLKLSVY